MSHTSRIAELLQISADAAIHYCEQVRNISRLGSKLQYKVIAQFVSKHPSLQHSPEQIARLIQQDKLKIPSPNRMPKNDKFKPHARSRRWEVPRRIKDNLYELPKPEPSTPLPKNVVQTSYLDQKRVSPEKMGRCLHGVVRIQVCAICDQVKYREMNGFD